MLPLLLAIATLPSSTALSASAAERPGRGTWSGCSFYVSAAKGADGGTGNSAASPFKTIQHGVDVAAAAAFGGNAQTVCLMADSVHYITSPIHINGVHGVRLMGDPDAGGGGRPVVSGAALIEAEFASDPGPAGQGAAASRVSADVGGLGIARPSMLVSRAPPTPWLWSYSCTCSTSPRHATLVRCARPPARTTVTGTDACGRADHNA